MNIWRTCDTSNGHTRLRSHSGVLGKTSLIWLLLFEHGHFQEKLQMKKSIILLQRHIIFRKGCRVSSVTLSYIELNCPRSALNIKADVNFLRRSVENTVILQYRIKISKFWNFQSLENKRTEKQIICISQLR